MKMTSKQFIRYLKEKGCYYSWKRQAIKGIKSQLESGSMMLCHQCGTNLKKFVEYFAKANAVSEIIMYSFKWRDTQEGNFFWNEIYKELREIRFGKKKIKDAYVDGKS